MLQCWFYRESYVNEHKSYDHKCIFCKTFFFFFLIFMNFQKLKVKINKELVVGKGIPLTLLIVLLPELSGAPSVRICCTLWEPLAKKEVFEQTSSWLRSIFVTDVLFLTVIFTADNLKRAMCHQLSSYFLFVLIQFWLSHSLTNSI